VLYALRHPAILLGLLLGFVIGVVLRAALQQRVAPGLGRFGRGRSARGRLGRPRLARVGAGVPRQPWTSYLDPYGAVAAVVAGVGWGARAPAQGPRGRQDVRAVAIAVGVHGVLAVAGFAAYRALASSVGLGPLGLGQGIAASDVLHGSFGLPGVGVQVALGFAVENLACGLLALVPIPPLELGVVLWSRLPRTPGARRFAYHLLEEAWGVAVILVGLLLPLAGQRPPLLALIDIVAAPLLRLV
jgi:hypothetical protein